MHILDNVGVKNGVTLGHTFVIPGRIGPDDFEGFWSNGDIDLPDWLDGPLYGTVQKIKSDDDGKVTYMNVGVSLDRSPPQKPHDDQAYGIELFNVEELAEFLDHVHWR